MTRNSKKSNGRSFHVQGNVDRDTLAWMEKHRGDKTKRGFTSQLLYLGIERYKEIAQKELEEEIAKIRTKFETKLGIDYGVRSR